MFECSLLPFASQEAFLLISTSFYQIIVAAGNIYLQSLTHLGYFNWEDWVSF